MLKQMSCIALPMALKVELYEHMVMGWDMKWCECADSASWIRPEVIGVIFKEMKQEKGQSLREIAPERNSSCGEFSVPGRGAELP